MGKRIRGETSWNSHKRITWNNFQVSSTPVPLPRPLLHPHTCTFYISKQEKNEIRRMRPLTALPPRARFHFCANKWLSLPHLSSAYKLRVGFGYCSCKVIIYEDKEMGNNIKEKPEFSKYPRAGQEVSQRTRDTQEQNLKSSRWTSYEIICSTSPLPWRLFPRVLPPSTKARVPRSWLWLIEYKDWQPGLV